jgi:hypothetical protein
MALEGALRTFCGLWSREKGHSGQRHSEFPSCWSAGQCPASWVSRRPTAVAASLGLIPREQQLRERVLVCLSDAPIPHRFAGAPSNRCARTSASGSEGERTSIASSQTMHRVRWRLGADAQIGSRHCRQFPVIPASRSAQLSRESAPRLPLHVAEQESICRGYTAGERGYKGAVAREVLKKLRGVESGSQSAQCVKRKWTCESYRVR